MKILSGVLIYISCASGRKFQTKKAMQLCLAILSTVVQARFGH
jgi:hypothetical protein